MASDPVLPSEDAQVSLGIDDLHISLQAEQEDTQKKTFTCWINSQLAKHTPPSVISDLFTDIKQGHVLLDLLEVLSGQQLPRDKGSNTFQCRINIEHALTFLKNRSIKLINIHVADIVEGNPSIILGLIWTIILHFHIEELARLLSCTYSQPSMDSETVTHSSPTASPPAKKSSKAQARWQLSAKKALLLWAQEQCATSESLRVTDFKSSWRSGMAFLAVIHSLRPDLVDMESSKHRSNKDNLAEAFRIAEQELKIPRLLEPEDVDVVDPDEKSIMTYVAQFLQYSKTAPPAANRVQGKVRDAVVWLGLQEEKLRKVLQDSESEACFEQHQSLLSFMESFDKEKRCFMDILSLKGDLQELGEGHTQLREAWDGLNRQISAWKTKLNDALPSPLREVEGWLQAAEGLVEEGLPASREFSVAMVLTQEKMTLFKSLMDKSDPHSDALLAFENQDGNHLPLVPPKKLEEMKKRLRNILEKNFIAVLEFHYWKCSVLGLLDEVKSKLDAWNVKFGNRESVELLLEDWRKFIEEKEFLVQLDASFQKCEEIYKNMDGGCANITEQYMTMEQNIHLYKQNIYNVRSVVQKVLACWATYTETLRLLKTYFENTKKEQIQEVPFKTLSQWNIEHTTLNDVGNFLIEVSNDEVGSSVSKELRRLNKRWRKFLTKTPLEMKLPLTKNQDQPIFDDSESILSKEEKLTVDVSADLSVELPKNYNQDLKSGQGREKKNEEFTGQLKVAEEVEKLAGQVEIWEAEAQSFVDRWGHHSAEDSAMEESLQHLIAKGSMYEELLARTEAALQMDVQNISSQESLQHVLTTGLQAKVQEANEKVQITVVKLNSMLKNSSETSPELDVMQKMEESRKELESYIKKAQRLLGQRERKHGALIPTYKEALEIFNTNSLAKYLKTIEELKFSVAEESKLSLEEKSREACAAWESLHHEISLYIQELKINIEKGKLSDSISKLEKQINKEKKLIRRGKTKGLIKEHEACFSKEAMACQLDQHMGVLRMLCGELTSQESQEEVQRALSDYQRKIDRLLQCASEIRSTLQASAGGTSQVQETAATAKNGRRDLLNKAADAKPDHQPSAEEAMKSKNFSVASELQLQEEESIMGEKDPGDSTNSLRERYKTHKEILELHLQNNKFKMTSDFCSEKERSAACLQEKLRDLQVLKNETNACWEEFEVTSLKLENLVGDMEKPVLVEARSRLQGKESEFQMPLNTRMESLDMALRVVLPVEKESLLLCGSVLPLREVAIQEFRLVDAEGIYHNLKNIQGSIAKEIEICTNLQGPGNSVLRELHPLDLHAAQSIVLKCRTQLEHMSHVVQRRKDALTALEDFLASLRTARLSQELVTGLSASGEQVAPDSTLPVKNTEGKIRLLKDKARHLDERLRKLDISLKDNEQGEEATCAKLLDVLTIKLLETGGCGTPQELTEESKLLEACSSKNNELFKNIQDVQNQINKIGLRDPTVPAVKHRKKSLIRLERDLDGFEEEKQHLEEMAGSLPQFEDGREKALIEQCQDTVLLWESTKASVSECLEQCGRVLELLKQYQNFKSVLTTLIQKEEIVISQQASYMGKENLRKRMAEIEIVKEEFNEHLEVVDKINQICKNLQFHLNKMKTFEEPPFEKEANVIVDRWLDINEKTEDYYENLGRALALWDKLFNLKNFIEEWTEKTLQTMGSHQLTDDDRERLKKELQIHEQQTSEFSKRVAEIQFLLQSSEKPLELQVMESFVLNKMEHIRKCVTGESHCRAPSSSTAELREDLDQAKTQIGVTESLLKALSPSDSLEIFTKLEEIQQQILQQKHSMLVLESQIGCLTPELSELKKQYESVSDLFNTKKGVLQDHFSTLLNDQCKSFNDWLSNVKMSLKECCESSETKASVEQKLRKLSDFLTLEGRSSKIEQVGTVLQHVKKHLPKAHVKELNSWLVSQEFELGKTESLCQARAKELDGYLQQLLRLQDDCRNLSKWLMNQEEKWKEVEESGEKTELLCQALARKREQFESVAQLNNFLKEHGLTEEEEIIVESTHLIGRYQTLLRQLHAIEEEEKLPPAEDQAFNDLARDVIHWIQEIKESLMALNSSEGKMPLEERIQKIKEIILLKPDGDARIQAITRQAQSVSAPLVQDTLTDITSQWDNTLHLASTYLSHQEKLMQEGEKYLQSKEDLRLMLIELKKKQEAGFALQHGLLEKKTQLKNYKKFLQKAQDLTSLLKELKAQGSYLLECTKNPSFSEEPWLEIKHLHQSLLQQLQDSVQKLEGHVEEHHSYQVCITDLNTTLDHFSKELVSFSDTPVDQTAFEDKLKKLQELESSLILQDGSLKKILALANSIEQNTSSVGQKIIKDDIKSLKCKQKDLENRITSAKQETESHLNSLLKSERSTEKQEKFALPGGQEQATSHALEATQNLGVGRKLDGGDREINKNSAVEMALSKPLSPNIQESVKDAADEQKVSELQNQPLELDIMLQEEQLQEIEELYAQLETKKAATEPLEQSVRLQEMEPSALAAHDAKYPAHRLDPLLQALSTLKKNKERQYCLLKDFQEHLAAVESSLKAFAAEKESLKVGPLDSEACLRKTEKCLRSIEEEKGSLRAVSAEWESVAPCVADVDRMLLNSRVRQLEQGWQQLEGRIQQKYSRQVAERGAFTSLMSKVRDMELSLQQQQQQWLRSELDAPEEPGGRQSAVVLAAELQATRHAFSALKGQADLQMKRIWGEREKKILEDAINNLKKQLEALEPFTREVEGRVKKCGIKNKVKETLFWAKKLSSELAPSAPLLPGDILSQIRKCKAMHDSILDKQQAVDLLVEEVKGVIPSLTAYESDDLNNLLEDLHSQYQMLVLKSTQRSQQLELKLEERRSFFEMIRKAQLTLHGSEPVVTPKGEASPTEPELECLCATLQASQKELQEVDSVISACLQELTDIPKNLNVFERLFLDDHLMTLKTRANRIQSFLHNKHQDVERKISSYRTFREQVSQLQKEISHVEHNKLLLKPESGQDAKEELHNLKDGLAGIRHSILQALKLKEVFDCRGLNWDGSQLDQLLTQVLERERELEEKIEQLDTVVAEHSKHQASLSQIKAVDLQIKEKAELLQKAPNASPESDLLDAQILIGKIEKAKCLCNDVIKKLSENKAFDDSFKEKEIMQLKLKAEENDELHKVLQNRVLDFQPKEVDEKHFQNKLENSLHVLNQIKSQLEQPLLTNLKIECVQNEKDRCETLQEQVQTEICNIKAMTVTEKPGEEKSSETGDIETKLRGFEDLQMQLSKSIDLHTHVLSDAYENVTLYTEAVTKALDTVSSLEAIFASHGVDLQNPNERLELSRWKQEELESMIAAVEDLTEKLRPVCSSEATLQLQGTLQDLVSKSSALKEAARAEEAEIARCLEDHKCYQSIKEEIRAKLQKMKVVLGQSMCPLPVSYKEALERLDQSKALVSNLISVQEELMRLRQVSRHLRRRCAGGDGVCVVQAVAALWAEWLSLLEAAKAWEAWSEDLRQQWKFTSEEIEREAIILENLQEELPEIPKTKESATTEELSELLDALCRYEGTVEEQQLLLALLLQRTKGLQDVPSEAVKAVPALKEITAMQEQCDKILHKARNSKELLQTEIQERNSFTREIIALKNLFHQTTATFQNMALEGHSERAKQCQELQSMVKTGKLTLENIMEKLRIKYSEMYTIVPAEITSQVEECRRALEDMAEKVSSEVLRSSPTGVMSRKIGEINSGLQHVEKMLQQKSQNIEKAHEVQKEIWDELDLWHSKLNELDAEVQDIVEQDPGRAQEWMDELMGPFQQYQQVSQRAESRTSQLNKATAKMEEYSDLLKSTEAWIENTSRLLTNPAHCDSSKALSHHASTLRMALEDCEQKHNLLHSIFTNVEDLSIIFETHDLIQSIQDLSQQVAALQQEIMENLPHIQQTADDVVAIESEVKSMEKKVSKIKTILLSKEIFDFSPEEHLKHGEVIIQNIHPMKKTIAEILSYQVELRRPQMGTEPLPVFQRTNQLLQDVKLLENVTQEQNELLKIIIKQTNECDEEIENLKQALNNYSAEFSLEADRASEQPAVQEEIEGMEEQILRLNQKKEDLLVGLKTAVLSLHQHLKQDQQAAGAAPSAGVSEGGAAERDAAEWKLDQRGSMSFLPALEEEAEESSVKSECGHKKAEPSSGSWSLLWKHDKDLAEDGASSSSATIIQRAAPPAKAAPLAVSDERGACGSTVERTRPQPAEVLHVCQTQVAELELWLQQANVAFEPETLNSDMQQVVEQELVGCQAMLREIEHKVASLLESCKDQGLGDSGATQQEAEALSLKLKTVKCNLEKVQTMLQEKSSEDQHPAILKKPSEHPKVSEPVNLFELESIVNERPQFSRPKDIPHQQVLELKPVEQKDLIRFIEFNAKKMWPQYRQQDKDTTHELSVSKASDRGNQAADLISLPQGHRGDKWQYLRHQLLSKVELPLLPRVEPQIATNMNILPSVSVYNFRYPTTEELKTYTSQLEDLQQEARDLQTQENMTEETYVNLDKKLFELFLTLSQCLSSVEELLQTPGLFRESAAAQQVHCEELALELKKLYLALGDKKDDLLKAMSWPGKNTDLLLECFDGLRLCLERAQANAASRSKSLKAGIDYSRSYQNEIKQLYDQLVKNKTALQQSLNEISGQSIGEQLQKVDRYTAALQGSESRVAKLRREGERLPFPYVLLQEVYKLEDVLDSMWGILRAKYSELSGPFLSESQLEALLQGLAELVNMGKEKLARDHLKQAKSKSALQAEIQTHKVFFQKLVAGMLLIQTCSAKMRPSPLQKMEASWAEQVAEVRALEDEARRCGTKLEGVLQKWEDFDENYASLEKDLEILASTLPTVSLVEETEERLLERISFYQQIKRNIDGKHARLYQTLSEGKQLVGSVSCPELEAQVTRLEEQWLALSRRVDSELHRLQTLLRHLLSYNRDSDELTKWLESSQQILNYWKEQSLNVSQDLDTIRSNINRFFEFSKEVDKKSSLKTAVLSTGSQLLHLKEADTATLRASLAQFEQKWTMLITQLPDIQEKLHQLQMEKLPSREAITELISWMSTVDRQAANGGAVHSPSSASQVKNLLHKLKEFRMEMDYKQWIVDFVNQSLLQLSTCDVESKRYERTEFAEHLGEMNRQWHQVHGTLNRKIQHLEQLLESITENENKVQTLNNWLEAQEERLRALQRPESVVSVEKLLLDCQDIENQLAIKSKALDDLRQAPLSLEGGATLLLEEAASGIDELAQKARRVMDQVSQFKASLQTVREEWNMYDQLYEEVSMMAIRFGHCVLHSKPETLSLEALQWQVQELQCLQDEAENSERSWEELREVIGKLKVSCPSIAEIIEKKCQDTHTRWTQANQDLAEQVRKAQSPLQLLEAYHHAHTEATARLEQQEAKFQQFADINMSGNNLAEILPLALQDIKELQRDVQKTEEALLQNAALLDQLSPQPTPSSAPGLLSGQLHSLQRATYLAKMLLRKADEFEFVLSQFKDFGDQLESLKDFVTKEEENLDELYQQEKEGCPDSFLNHVLALAAESPDLERLNQVSLKLPLSDIAIKTLQSVTRQWTRATATALDHCSELQESGLNEKFLPCCEKWVQLLEKLEEALKEDIADSLPALLEQQKTFEMLEAEVSINQAVADSFVTQCLHLLDTAEVEQRPEFISEFSKLADQWQRAAQGIRQRRLLVDELARQWQHFTTSMEGLRCFLSDTSRLLSAVKGQDCCSLYQTRSLIHELKSKEIHSQRWKTTYTLALEMGEKLLDTCNPETTEFVDRKISWLQDNWKATELQLVDTVGQLQSTARTWDQCEKKIKELKQRLQALKAQSKNPLPELHEDLHKEKELIKELEKALATWSQNLTELGAMKAELAAHVLAEDVVVLEEQMEHLHRQWEDLCQGVTIRKQEVEDRLNSWIVFNEKNKELCAWLVQMENKVLQTADISIEEMIEKLQKDCMEEINLFSENKFHLKQMGDQLIKASSKARAAEVDDKLHKINDRWQHLFDVIGSRVKKLKETFAFIQQLDKNMSNLRTWLARIESELSKPVVYDVCDDQEIQKRLAEQQDLQRDIEQHSAGVESVFNICDVLLHDSDACASETECDSVQQTTRSLDRRWRNICAMSMERRMKIEETWRLWQKFLDDYSRFEDWLKSAERTAACPNSSEVLYTSAKEDLKRFEAFQRQIHERLTQLELINKQYRRLARENRTDTASKLKQMVHEGNQRWDSLQKRVTAVLRRLRHFTNQREEFEGTRESILVWLTEMDLQLTNVEHFSESDADDKMRQLNGFQQEITLNTNKIDQLIVFGEQLIQKSEPLDAVLIEDELEELHRYCQEVFGRVARFHQRLTSRAPGLEDEKEASENEGDMEDPREIQTDAWRKRAEGEEPSAPQSLCHLVPPAAGHERSGCETPVSVDSIPLEWDHTGDVGGSSSHEEDEEGPYYSALSDVEIPENPEAYLKMTTKTLKASSGKSISDGHSWHVPDSPSRAKRHYKQMEGDRNVPPLPSDSSTPYKPAYVKLLLHPGTEGGKGGPGALNGSPQQEEEQLASLPGQPPGAFDRWELIQAQELHSKLRIRQNMQQLNSDMGDITAWLEKTEAELETLKMAKPPSTVEELELRVKRLQEILKAFDTYKALMVAVNVRGKESLPKESAEFAELQSRLGQLSLHWEAVQCAVDSWRTDLRQSLMQCQDFHQLSQNLLLWLSTAENRRQRVHVTTPEADQEVLLECQKELKQLEKELAARQPQVNSLQAIAASLLKGHEGDYIEAEEKVHVIEKKLQQLREQVAQDVMSLQRGQDPDSALPGFDGVDSWDQPPAAPGSAPQAKQFRAERTTEEDRESRGRVPSPAGRRPQRSFLSRVIRAALPLQLLLLLLLLLACLLPTSEEDYSCTQANNFARSFYPMLRYTNGPPPT